MSLIKSPKDMSAVEFVDYLINGSVLPSVPDDASFIQVRIIKDALKKPAPNPFTPDQLAVLRELQRNGFGYAAKDPCDTVFAYENEPEQDEEGYWTAEKVGGNYIELPFEFLAEALDSEDKKPLCFADCAPLEGAEHA